MAERKEFQAVGQQGDVLLNKIHEGELALPDPEKFGTPVIKTHTTGEDGIVLRMGEVTDHGHVVRALDPNTTVKFVERTPHGWRAQKEEYVMVIGGRAILEHTNVKTKAPAEHGSLVLVPGTYKLTTVQEFNYDDGRQVNVLD